MSRLQFCVQTYSAPETYAFDPQAVLLEAI